MFRYLSFLLIGITTHVKSQDIIQNAHQTMRILCSDTLHGRGYVQEGQHKAALWIADFFEKNAIYPLSEKGYFQKFSTTVNTFPSKNSIQLGNKELTAWNDYMISPYSSGIKGSFQVFPISIARLLDKKMTFEFTKDSFCFVIDLTKNDEQTLFEQNTRTIYSLSQKAPLILLTDKKFLWSVSSFQFEHPIVEIQKKTWDKHLPQKIQLDITTQLKENFLLENVIGYIPSKNKDAKTIAFSAHYDHLGRMGEVLFPGANDNASGTALLLELAKSLKNESHDVNLIFFAFAGEEAGLLGSKYFVNSPLFVQYPIDFLINIDIMGGCETGIGMVNAIQEEKAFLLIDSLNKASKEPLKRIKKRGISKNSDHYPFIENGVQAIYIYSEGNVKNYHDNKDYPEDCTLVGFETVFEILGDFVEEY